MIVNFSISDLSIYCKKNLGLSLHDFFRTRDVVCVHVHYVCGNALYYVTPFYCDESFNACKDSGIVPYYVSSDSFSELIRFLHLRFPNKQFNFFVYEK